MPFEVQIFCRFFVFLKFKLNPQFYFCSTTSRSFVTRFTKLKKIEKNLGLPEKPKRPATAYNRFFKETYRTLENLDNKKPPDVAREIGTLWKQCDAIKQEKYKQAFEKDQVSTVYLVFFFSPPFR